MKVKYKLKKPLPFAPKGTKVTVRKVFLSDLDPIYELIIHAEDGEHYHEVYASEIKEWLKFIKPDKKNKTKF